METELKLNYNCNYNIRHQLDKKRALGESEYRFLLRIVFRDKSKSLAGNTGFNPG